MVEINGYSRGATIAALACEDISFKYPKYAQRIQCWTYGCPKFLSKSGMKIWQERNVVIRNYLYGNDIATKVCPLYYRPSYDLPIGPKRVWYKLSVEDHKQYEWVK